MVGLLMVSPIFASLGKRLVGVDEASLISLAAPFIDDHAPVDQAFNLLYVDQPIGTRFSYTFDRSDICHFEDGVSNNLSDFLQLRLKCKGCSSSSQVSSEIILKKKLELEDKLLDAPPNTLGAAALALRTLYASVGER